jgi:hypothetical protein
LHCACLRFLDEFFLRHLRNNRYRLSAIYTSEALIERMFIPRYLSLLQRNVTTIDLSPTTFPEPAIFLGQDRSEDLPAPLSLIEHINDASMLGEYSLVHCTSSLLNTKDGLSVSHHHWVGIYNCFPQRWAVVGDVIKRRTSRCRESIIALTKCRLSS